MAAWEFAHRSQKSKKILDKGRSSCWLGIKSFIRGIVNTGGGGGPGQGGRVDISMGEV